MSHCHLMLDILADGVPLVSLRVAPTRPTDTKPAPGEEKHDSLQTVPHLLLDDVRFLSTKFLSSVLSYDAYSVFKKGATTRLQWILYLADDDTAQVRGASWSGLRESQLAKDDVEAQQGLFLQLPMEGTLWTREGQDLTNDAALLLEALSFQNVFSQGGSPTEAGRFIDAFLSLSFSLIDS